MSIGWLFPGQGAQSVGMGLDVAAASPEAAAVLAQASEVLGFDLARVIRDGPESELSRTDVCQPAILAVSIAMLEAARRRAPGAAWQRPACAAGLSLGEYTALVAAGAIDFGDAVRLVRGRGRYMQEACEAQPGAMFSVIGLEDADVEAACREAGEGVWPANYNCPGQLVISGRPEPAARAAELCKARKARMVVQLNVAGAFHTELMAPAADRLAADLDQTPIRTPAFPVISNVSARPVHSPDEIRDLLKRQLTAPVRWTESMRGMIAAGVDGFYEFGPGKAVLAGLLKRIDRAATCVSIGTQAALEKLA